MYETINLQEKNEKINSSFLSTIIVSLAFYVCAYLLQFVFNLLNYDHFNTVSLVRIFFFSAPYVALILFVVFASKKGWLPRIFLAVAFGLFSFIYLYHFTDIVNILNLAGLNFSLFVTTFAYFHFFLFCTAMTVLVLVPKGPRNGILKATGIVLIVLSCVMTFFYIISLIASIEYSPFYSFFFNLIVESFFLVNAIILGKFFLKLAKDETALEF